MYIKDRLKSLRRVMREKELDAILIPSQNWPESTTLPNVYYFTDYYDVWPTCLLMTAATEMLLTFEPDKARKTTGFKSIFDLKEKKISDHLKELKRSKLTIGIDGNIDYNYYTALNSKLRDATFVDISRDIYSIRAIKDEQELIEIKNACLLGDRVLDEVVSEGLIGNSEKMIAEMIKSRIVGTGKEWSFPVLVSGDEDSAYIHGTPTTRKFKNLVMIDMGVKSSSYSSDMTRTFLFSKDPAMRQAYTDLKDLHHMLDDEIVPGMDSKDIDRISREFLESRGHKDTNYSNFHALGHGIGLEVHESPTLSPRSSMTLKKNMVFTLEPAIYVKGKYGIRLEDTVVLNKNGIERLTRFPFER